MQICKHVYYGKCANPDCPIMEGRRPVPSTPGVCKYEEFAPHSPITDSKEYTETMTAEITIIHKLDETTPEYEAALKSDPAAWLKDALNADDVRISNHKIFKKG